MTQVSESDIKHYLACWFQLGKKVVSQHQHEILAPHPIFCGDRYSQEFEHCWQTIVNSPKSDYYLEGTDCSIKDLLSPGWEIRPCARCEMPIALRTGKASPLCPCSDLAGWPNSDLPKPRQGVDSQAHLQRIRDRLKAS